MFTGYDQISDCYVHTWYICYCYYIAGHSLGARMYLKTKTLKDNAFVSKFVYFVTLHVE